MKNSRICTLSAIEKRRKFTSPKEDIEGRREIAGGYVLIHQSFRANFSIMLRRKGIFVLRAVVENRDGDLCYDIELEQCDDLRE